ncbi:hypothetical protein LEM8419_01261 [Neolewinella maritima]|uniref:Phospholipid/glycerol acyltransferase domain-containing protein n=1 Tax=Neolewinella maritima TaxID=1383882 RepID=A0ABM9AZP7_9BACT|nr:lysophospholipid acyltransferase family protein [Neolewinella maritima]CAH1000104.1 hypothetical protein LEM8419_01261 [Neolewinella maritima]
MIYHLVRPVARYVLRYYYRNIDLTGLENIPQNAAVILAANHPTAFIEPCLLACFQPRPLHFLARGDLYKNRVASWLLRALQILPVYRLKDGGYQQLTRNYATFQECYDVLSQQQALMILAEGSCVHEKRLRPLRKGTARIALGALDRDPSLKEVYIVPIGVNFTAAERVRSDVMIRCGKAIHARQFMQAYLANEARGIHALTEALTSALSELVIQLPNAATDTNYEAALQAVQSVVLGRSARGVTTSGAALDLSLRTVRRYDPMDQRIPDFNAQLRSEGLHPQDVLAATEDTTSSPRLLLPAALLLLPQLPLWGLAELIARTGPKTIEFYSPVRFAVVAVGTLLYVPLVLLLPWYAAVYLLASAATTTWCITQVEEWLAWTRAKRARRLGRKPYDKLRTLVSHLIK